MKKYFHSRTVVFALFVLVLLNRFCPAWGPNFNNGRMIMWDVYGYYLYLPAMFIHHDPGLQKQAWIDDLQKKYAPTPAFYQAIPGKDGKQVIKYSMGTAILWLPFFLIAHVLAGAFGFPADGLSPPYSWAILIGGLIYALIGLWFLRKILLRYFNDRVTCIVLILITMGTNYWGQTASDTIMPHSTMFVLNVMILWFTIRWHETSKLKFAALLGLTLGLATISRPTEVIWVIVPVLWGIHDKASLLAKIRMLWQQWKSVLVFGAAFVLMLMPQLLYWRYTSGSWVFYSYGERFALDSPFLYKMLFSYKKGWFVYTPLMLFACWGFRFIWKNKREIFWPLLLFVTVNVWVISSWECWWYAACLSVRALMEMLPAMAIPLGFLIVYLDQQAKSWVRWPAAMLILFCFALNLFQHWQYNHGIIDGERMTKAYYWRIFGKTSITGEDRNLLEVDHWPPDEHLYNLDGLLQKDFYYIDFDRNSPVDSQYVDTSFAHSGKHSCRLEPGHEFSPVWKRPYHFLTNKEYAWVRAEAWICIDDTTGLHGDPPLLVISYEARGRALKYKSVPLDMKDLKPGEWRRVTTDYMTPYPLYNDDQVASYIWHRSPAKIHVDDFQIEAYEPIADAP